MDIVRVRVASCLTCCLVHGLLLSFLLEYSLYVGVSEIINFQKLVGNLDKMIVANFDSQH